MGPIAERIVLEILKKLLTSDLIRGKEAEAIAWLRNWAKANPGQIDDFVIELLAIALGVP